MAPPQEKKISVRNQRRATVKFQTRELKRAAKAAALHSNNVIAKVSHTLQKSRIPYIVCHHTCKIQCWSLHLTCEQMLLPQVLAR